MSGVAKQTVSARDDGGAASFVPWRAFLLVHAGKLKMPIVTRRSPTSYELGRQELIGMIAEMGGHTEKQLMEAIDALSTGDANHGKRIISADAALDALQRAIDERRSTSLKRKSSLRMRFANSSAYFALSTTSNGSVIARRISVSASSESTAKQFRVSHTRRSAHGRARASPTAGCAQQLCDAGQRKALGCTDATRKLTPFTSLFREVLANMIGNRHELAYGIHLLFCAKNIERIGDHVTNIAEAIVLMVEGRTLSDERPKADATEALCR